jgi:GNAT superfamily N-acetyltransferase
MQPVAWTIELSRRLEHLFPQDPPVPTRLWAVLDGLIQGCILIDELNSPGSAFIVDVVENHIYLGGALSAPVIQQAFTILGASQPLVACLWPGDPVLSMLPGGQDYAGVAIDFSERSPQVDLERLAAIPPGYELRRIDAAYARAVPEFDYYVKMFGSLQGAVENMVGYYLAQGERVACEAVAAPLTRGVAELGVETHSGYQQKGLATALCAYVMRECEAQGYRTFWNAAEQNTASVALARKLGLRREQRMTVMAWPAGGKS